MRILGWYSFIILSTATIGNIINDKNKALERLLGVLLLLPILIYLWFTLMK